MANEYLATHPELIAEAKPIVERWRAEGMFRVRGRAKLRRVSQILFAKLEAKNGYSRLR